MWSILRRNPLAALLALLMHVAIVAFLVVGVDWRKPPVPVSAKVAVVKARVVDEAKLTQQIEALQEKQDKRQAEETARREREAQELAKLVERQAEEKARLAALEAERKQSEAEVAKRRERAREQAQDQERRLAELERQRIAAEKQGEAEEQARRQAEAKKQAEEEARRQAEAKKKAEEEARRQAEAKKKAEEEALRQAELKKQRQAAERARQQQLARQRELEAQLQAERDQVEIGRIVAAIKQKVERSWLRPPGTADRGLTCRVRVRLGSNGTVLLVSVIESSGNGAFDRSVESAVRKADPLPMPSADRLKSRFSELTFEFDPTG